MPWLYKQHKTKTKTKKAEPSGCTTYAYQKKPQRIRIKLCLLVGIRDVVKCTKFGDDQLRGLGVKLPIAPSTWVVILKLPTLPYDNTSMRWWWWLYTDKVNAFTNSPRQQQSHVKLNDLKNRGRRDNKLPTDGKDTWSSSGVMHNSDSLQLTLASEYR